MEDQATPEGIDQIWLREHRAFEEHADNLIVVDSQPKKWHPKLIALKNRVVEAARIYESRKAAKDKAARDRARSKAKGLDLDAITFLDVAENGMIFNKRDAVAFRVSSLTLNRALAIANTLFFEAESRGCTVAVDEQGSRLCIKFESASFSIAIRERQDFTLVKRTDFAASWDPEKQYRQTDKLAIAIDKYPGSKFEFVDTTTRRVEQCLNDLFIRMYTTVVASRAADRVNKIKDVQRAIANQAYEAITRQRAIEATQKTDLEARRKLLIDESALWHHAQQIRAYLNHVRDRSENPQHPEMQEWIKWAMNVADHLDPTSKRIESIHKP